MIKMFHVSKKQPIKIQLEEIWKDLYIKRMHEDFFAEIEPKLTLNDSTSNTSEEQMNDYLFQMSNKHEEIVVSRGMNTGFYKLENGDFVIAIDDELYIG